MVSATHKGACRGLGNGESTNKQMGLVTDCEKSRRPNQRSVGTTSWAVLLPSEVTSALRPKGEVG
jgi:hypothetical protein